MFIRVLARGFSVLTDQEAGVDLGAACVSLGDSGFVEVGVSDFRLTVAGPLA